MKKIDFIDSYLIESVSTKDLKHMVDSVNYDRVTIILSAAIETAAGKRTSLHYVDEAEQDLFNHLSRIFQKSGMVTKN